MHKFIAKVIVHTENREELENLKNILSNNFMIDMDDCSEVEGCSIEVDWDTLEYEGKDAE